MKILKYRRGSNGKYKIVLDTGMELVLYEEVILEYNLLLNKIINEEILVELDKANQECDVYHVALKTLNSRIKSIEDLRFFLIKKEDIK